jgi:Cation efflux family
MRIPVTGTIADAFVVKHESAAAAGGPGGVKAIVLMHPDVIAARDLASPIIVFANAVRVRHIERLNQILAHQISTVIGAAETFKCTILQCDRLKFRKNRFAQLSSRSIVRETPNHDRSGSCESDEDECDADEWSFQSAHHSVYVCNCERAKMMATKIAKDQDLLAGKRLEYFTLGWNLMEALVAVGAGVFAGSVALIAFGIDSLIESLSGGILLWRLHGTAAEPTCERVAQRLVGISFFLLAAYVGFEAGTSLLHRQEPEASIVGIILSIVSLIVMPLLARAKRRVAARINSGALVADSRQTDICAYLSAIVLGGLLLNAVFGWWWADPVAALCMLPMICWEGIEAVRGESWC